jgi:hypothetical protein
MPKMGFSSGGRVFGFLANSVHLAGIAQELLFSKTASYGILLLRGLCAT